MSALPVRAVRVGSTQSNMSTPASITSRIPSGSPIPMKYRGLPAGSSGASQSVVSNVTLAVLADREAADRVAVEVELDELLGRAPPELAVGAALDDREAELAGRALGVALAAGPLGGAADGVLELAPRDAGRRHLVEAHRDVAAEVPLDLGGELGREPRRSRRRRRCGT